MMTRAMFFKALAIIGLGQEPKAGECIGKDLKTGEYVSAPCSSQDVKCKEDEEKCPLGHCQKPAIFGVAPDYMANGTAVFGTVETSIPLRGCSTCGIVYIKGLQ